MTNTHHARRALTALAALGAAALALAGCSAAGDAGSTPGASGELTPIKLVVAPIHFEAAYLAQSEGFFAKHGLDVQITLGGAPTQNVAMALSGEADIAIGSWGTAITSIGQGVPLKVISGNGYTSPDFPTSGVIVRPDSSIKDVADLAGHTVGIQGLNTGSEVPLFFAAQAAKIPTDSFKRVEIASSGMSTALESGTVDSVLASAPYFNQLIAAGNRAIVYPSMEYLPYAPVTVWTVSEAWLASHEATAQAFNEAMTEADAFYMDPANADAVLDVTAKVSQVDRKALSADSLIPISVKIDVAAAQKQRDGFVDFGIVKSAPRVDDILWAKAPRSK